MTYDFEPHHDWHECTIEDACTIAALMGWQIDPKDVQFTGFWSQGDGASFTGTLSYAKGCAKAVRQYAPLDETLHDIADRWQALQKRCMYKLHATAIRTSHHYVHENTVSLECEHADDSYRELPNGTHDTATYIARDFMRWIYKRLEPEYEFQRTWQMACLWGETLVEECDAAREAARDAVTDYRATLYTGAPASALATLKAAIRRYLEEMVEACEARDNIASDFHYWQNGQSVSIEQFAESHL